MRLWIKDPLAILADGAERGVVVEGTRIVELVARGGDAGRAGRRDVRRLAPCRAARPRQRASSFLPDADPRPPGGDQPGFVPLAGRALSDLGAAEARHLRVAVRLALTELMLSGCTTAADHHYLFPPGLENAIDIEVEEARRVGLRMTVTRGSMNLSKKDGGLPPDEIVQDEETILADSERVLKLFHDPLPGADIRIALAPCSPFSVTKRLMAEIGRARRASRLPTSHPSLPERRRGALLPRSLWR